MTSDELSEKKPQEFMRVSRRRIEKIEALLAELLHKLVEARVADRSKR